MPDQQNITNIPSNRVEFIDPRTGLVSREWYRFFLNLFNLAGAGGNQISLDEMQIGPPPQPDSGGGGGGTGTVTSVAMTVPTGLDVTGSPITSSGTFAVTYAAGYDIPTTASQAQWDTAYTDRLKWDGGATDLVASTGRISLGATTVGGNFFTLPNPSAITFVQINADNTITTMDAPTFRTAIGAGTGAGSVTSVDTAGTVNGLTLTGGPITTSGTITLGGTLDLSSPPAIGATTAAAGTFTTLTATGQTSLGGAAGSEGLRVTPLASSTTYINARAGINGGNAQLGLVGTGNTDFVFYTLGTGAYRFLTGGVGPDQFRISHTASAVNYVQVTGAATGANPKISAQGSDSTVGFDFQTKGAKAYNFFTNTSNLQLEIPHVASVNWLQVKGSATGNGVQFSAAGSDTNISQVFQSKGTGAIDLAAGSRGVNISNGGTVTAITRTATGSAYTGFPTVAITAPTTAGGVQATATAQLVGNSATVAGGGTGYTVNDVLTVTTGGGSGPINLTVTAVSGGVITAVTSTSGALTSIPANPVAVSGGTGSGATFNIVYVVAATFTITNAGSGYVEQPTVSFSGGGGSGAAAYATVGSGITIRSIGAAGLGSIDFSTPASATNGVPALRIRDVLSSTPSNTGYFLLHNNNGYAQLTAQGPTDAQMAIGASGAGYIRFNTNGTGETNQMRITHTASAVNYVQVTGAATGGAVAISAQGSDSNVGLSIKPKGTSPLYLETAGATDVRIQPNSIRSLSVSSVSSAVNYGVWTNATAGNAPSLAVGGTDTNIDLTLTPKGTGVVRTSGTGIRLYGSTSGYVGLKGAAAAGSTTYTLPAADGASGQVLSTNGSATLSWATAASGNTTSLGMWENNTTISSNYSVTSGNNAMSAGPITVASGVVVTVPSGSVWTIV